MSLSNLGKKADHKRLNQWYATSICGNDILSSTFYVSGISIGYSGVFAPIVLLMIGLILFFYKSVYTEVVEALPTNGGAYNCLLNATSKNIAAIAGTTTVLSYIATAVISGESAIQYLSSLISVPIIYLTILLLIIFALLVISGIKDSAKVAFTIFSIHLATLTIFVLMGVYYIFHVHPQYLLDNLRQSGSIISHLGGIIPAIFFGFSASLLGVSGFESSANFVEEQQRGVFRKTLRNMLIGVVIFNPLIAFIALCVLPFHELIQTQNFLLSSVANQIGGKYFETAVVIDAFLVLSGAVLTAYVGVSGLIYRMVTDGCFPYFLAKINRKGSYPYIIILFALLCISILLATSGNLLSLAGVYTIAFLTVMTLFAFGNLIMRETRKELKRTYSAPIVFVVLAFLSTSTGIIGNIMLSSHNVFYFATYFGPAIFIVFSTIYFDYILLFLIRFSPEFIRKRLETVYINITNNGKFIVFIRHLSRLHLILDYINRNEIGKTVYLVYCNDNLQNNSKEPLEYKKLLKALPILKESGVFPDLNIVPIIKEKPFGPQVISEVSKELSINKNRILVGSIHHEHTFDYEDLGGVRIIF